MRMPLLLADFYKISHREAYPQNTQTVYSTWTPRTSRVDGIKHVVAFGFQGFVKKYLIEFFTDQFFGRPKTDIVAEYSRVIKNTLGVQNPSTDHIEALHDLAIGRVAVVKNSSGELTLRDGFDSRTHFIGDFLLPLFENGKLLRDDTLANIRARVASETPELEFEAI